MLKSKKSKHIAIILLAFAFVASYYYFIKAAAAPVMQFTADTNVSLSGLSAGDLQIGSNSECVGANISGAVLTITDITDGSVFTLKTPAHNNGLTLTPSGGVLDLNIYGGNISSDDITEWTLEATGNVNVAHTVGVAQANTQYAVKVDNVLLNNFQSNGSSEISFTYSGGWSVKVFTVEESSASTASTASSGGGLLPAAYDRPSPPPSGFEVIIKPKVASTEETQDQPAISIRETNDRTIILELSAGANVKRMAISEDPEFRDAGQEPFTETKTWTLSEGAGKKTVYVKFFTEYGVSSEIISIDIILLPPVPPTTAEPTSKTTPPSSAAPSTSAAATTAQPAKPPVQPAEQKPTTARPDKKTGNEFVQQAITDDLEIYKSAADSVYVKIAEKIILKIKENIIIAKQVIINIFDITINGIYKLIPNFIIDSYNKIGDWIKNELLELFGR